MNKRYTLFFNEASKNDLSIVGGKGANLGEMTGAGFEVPFGFCVTTECYKEFIAQNRLEEFIMGLVRQVDPQNVSQISEQIRNIIIETEIPERLKQEITGAVIKIGTDICYAVRSSATAEDLAFASFAGQQDTYLNVRGVQNILNSVRKCWASLFTDRAILYRIQNGIDHEKVHMAVIIQKNGSSSGIGNHVYCRPCIWPSRDDIH